MKDPKLWKTGAVPGWALPAFALVIAICAMDHVSVFLPAAFLLAPVVLLVWFVCRGVEDDESER